MSDKPPTPPADLPTEIVETLDGFSLDQLQHVARYAEELEAYRTRESRLETKSASSTGDQAVDSEDVADDTETLTDDIDDRPDDIPEDVPSKATITIKEINDNRYYYWQWRDGDKIKSKYEGPVTE